MLPGMDRTSLLIYFCRVEQKSLENARAAHEGASMVLEGGLIDEPALLKRATLLDGLATDYSHDLAIMRLTLRPRGEADAPPDPAPVVAPVAARPWWRFWRS